MPTSNKKINKPESIIDNSGKNVASIQRFHYSYDYELPEYVINRSRNLITWGKDNLEPERLLRLYNHNGSAEHKSIINKKVKYIAGNGFAEVKDERIKRIFANSAIDSEILKASLDDELFNGFALEVIRNKGGSIHSIKYMPFSKLRIAIDEDGEDINYNYIWFSRNWEKYRKEIYKPEALELFDGQKQQKKSIYYHSGYNPETDGLYPIPSYSPALNWIDLHYRISVWHLNQVRKGYAPSFILSFNDGVPTQEVQEEQNQNLQNSFMGEDGQTMLVTYSSGKDYAPELTPITLNDSDERFEQLMETIKSEIIVSHEIPPAMIELTAGKLASSDERKELTEEFQYSYIDQKQKCLEDAINEILATDGITEKVRLKTYKEARAKGNSVNNVDAGGTQETL